MDPIPNLDMVTDRLYRGGQPNALGIKELREKYRVGYILNLRDDPWQEEAAYCQRNGISYFHVPMSGVKTPDTSMVNGIVAMLKEWIAHQECMNHKESVYVHCQYGCDRTGVIIAAYRIMVLLENQKAALNDADIHGLSELLGSWRIFILNYGKLPTKP